MMTKEDIDYKLAAEQLRTGKPLFGKDGLAPKTHLTATYNPPNYHLQPT